MHNKPTKIYFGSQEERKVEAIPLVRVQKAHFGNLAAVNFVDCDGLERRLIFVCYYFFVVNNNVAQHGPVHNFAIQIRRFVEHAAVNLSHLLQALIKKLVWVHKYLNGVAIGREELVDVAVVVTFQLKVDRYNGGGISWLGK